MRNRAAALWVILLITVFGGSLIQGAIPAERYINLSDEALSSSGNKKAIEISTSFLDEYINSPVCASEQLTRHLSNLHIAWRNMGREEKYVEYCRSLFDRIDTSRAANRLRTFLIISLESKGDYDANASRIHGFEFFGENREGLEFFDSNCSSLPRELVAERPLVEAWLHIVRADLLSYLQEFDAADIEIAEADKILTAAYPIEAPERLIGKIAAEILEAQKGNWDQAIALALSNKEALGRFGRSKEAYALEGRLIEYFLKAGKYREAIEMLAEGIVRPAVFEAAPSLLNYGSMQGATIKNSPATLYSQIDFNRLYRSAAVAAFALGQKEKGSDYANRLLYRLEKEIAGNYALFAFNKARATDRGNVETLVDMAPRFALENPEDSLLQALNYEAALIYKQLSIHAGNFYRNMANRLNNKAIIKRYRELEKARESLETATLQQADSIMERISTLETNLQRNLGDRAGNMLTMMPSWKEVKQSLGKGEMAVEFFIASFPEGNKYIASLITPETPFPEILELCPTESLDTLTDFFGSDVVFKMVWEPIMKGKEGYSKVYFSPMGKLSLMPIEYVETSAGGYIGDVLNLQRLSSTRELMARNDFRSPEAIRLFGGIKYQLEDDEMDKTFVAAGLEEAYVAEIPEEETKGLRAGLTYLPATLEEVEKIGDMMALSGVDALRKEGAEATERAFRALSGEDAGIVHVATHGFSLSKKSRSRLSRYLGLRDPLSTEEQQELNRSGLMFAGAANTIDGKSGDVFSGLNDGILTGKELAALDLSGVRMAVLSACETGLGATDTEGVGGLQRGLKRSGVQTLVMSLWKVDDEATSLLMMEFYKSLLAGQTAPDALRTAREYVRTFEGGRYSDPRYWAAFIILD